MADLIVFIMYVINDVILTSLLFQKDKKCFNFLILLDTLFFEVLDYTGGLQGPGRRRNVNKIVVVVVIIFFCADVILHFLFLQQENKCYYYSLKIFLRF